jgi:hypothetical protein
MIEYNNSLKKGPYPYTLVKLNSQSEFMAFAHRICGFLKGSLQIG